MTRVYQALIVGLALLCAGLFLNANRHAADASDARASLSSLKAAYSAAEAEAKGLALAATENASKARVEASVARRQQGTQLKEQLNAQTQAHPDWSAGAVPDGVRESLRAARAGAARQPARVDSGGLPDS